MEVTGTPESGLNVALNDAEKNTVNAIAIYHGIPGNEAFAKMLGRSFKKYVPRTMAAIEGTPESQKINND